MNCSLKFQQLLAVAIAFSTILLVSENCLAQSQAERDRDFNDRDIQQRSWNLRMLSIMAAQKRPQKFNPQLALSQVQEDFKRIQQINKQLGLMALGITTFDLEFIAKSATEINKRAERLKENLALPGSTDAAKAPLYYDIENPAQLKAPIVDLARLILEFTDNPFSKEAGVVDTQAYKAHRDLDTIIELSGSVRDLSKTLGRDSASGQRPSDPAASAARRRQEIPEAALPYTAEEAKWWEKIRAVANDVKKNRDKDGDKFLQLLKEGREKSYQAPIPNRGPTFLRKVPPAYNEEARRQKISGEIALTVEFLQDGTVGEVTIVKGLGFGLENL